MANEVRLIEFEVVDNQTGRYPNCELIAVTEEWAKHLIYCDIDCFAITEDGALLLIDDCNNIAYPPSDRFTVKFAPESLRPKGRWELHGNDDDCGCSYFCSNCHGSYPEDWFWDHGQYVPFENCPHCTAKMEG